MLLKKFESIENILFFKKKLWILESDQLKLNIIREIHDQSVAEHSNVRRTCKYLNKWYYWSQVKQSVEKYVKNCHICRRFKASRDKYSELLNSLSISNRSWTDIIMNFVIELLKIKNDINAILMIINRFIKMHHYVLCITAENKTFAEKTTRLLINHVWKLHELSNIIISDRESQFISLVWKTICQILKIDVKLSTTFHSEIDDQSEIVNQKWSVICVIIAIISKMINSNDYQWSNSRSMLSFLSRQSCLHSWRIMNLNLEWISILQTRMTHKNDCQSKSEYWHKKQLSSREKWEIFEISSRKN
jgi:hypothetical protein